MRSAIAVWQPMASTVTMLFCRANRSSSSGMAVISFDLSPTQRWPSTRSCSLAQALTRSGTHQVQRRVLVLMVERASERLAIGGDHLALEASRKRASPGREAGLERLGVDQYEHAPEGVVRGDAVRQRQDGPEPGQLAAAVERDVVPALGTGDHRTHSDHQDVGQPVLDLAAAARIPDCLEMAD